MPINLETATITLYENSSLTEELTDEPAQTLLKWGEGQLKTLAAKTPDDEAAFEDSFKELRKLMKSMNRFTARRSEMTPEEQHDYLMKRILERAQALGLPCTAEKLTAYEAQQSKLDEKANVKALIALMQEPPPEDKLLDDDVLTSTD